MEEVKQRDEETGRFLEGNTIGNRWLDGESGNSKGPEKRAVSHLLKNDEKFSNKKLAQKLYELAMEGNMVAIKEILDRTEGKVKEEIEIKSINVTIVRNSVGKR